MFELKNLEMGSQEFVLTADKIQKWKSAVELILKLNHKDFEKQQVQTYTDRLNFACPFCGDSHKSSRKKRGNIWFDNLFYKCYNGDCNKYMPLDSFFECFGFNEVLEATDKHQIQVYKANNISNRHQLQWEDLWGIGEAILDREFIKERLSLVEIPGTPMEQYLLNRDQTNFQNFAYQPQSQNLFVFNTDSFGNKILGFQMRNMKFNGNGSKYFTYKLGKIYDMLGLEKNSKVEDADKISNLYGILKLNLNDSITIFEGPLDSFLLRNSLGICSLQARVKLDIPVRYLLDDDKDARKKTMEMLNDGFEVFLWGKLKHDLGIPNREKWDFNDLMLWCKQELKMFNVDDYFSKNKLDIVWI
jgi:hypothetical protein